jgi:hypothetical protein
MSSFETKFKNIKQHTEQLENLTTLEKVKLLSKKEFIELFEEKEDYFTIIV